MRVADLQNALDRIEQHACSIAEGNVTGSSLPRFGTHKADAEVHVASQLQALAARVHCEGIDR